jgi:curved DNA-binding protein CbpA
MDKCRVFGLDLDNGWDKSERLLGVSMDASAEVKRSAYRALAKVHHPDHGGDREKFEAIQKAYEEITA